MNELKETLKSMISISGLSGYEQPIRDVISTTWKPLVDEISVSRLGSLHALKRGNSKAPRPSILLSTHMDAIGMIVTGIKEGLLRFTEIGGIDPRILPGQLVTIHGRRDLPGVIIQPADHLLPPSQQGKPVAMEYLFVDSGLSYQEVDQLVQVGDLISFSQSPIEFQGNALAGHSLDNRASVAAVTECLLELSHTQHAWDVWAVASVQEEETMAGAITSPFQLKPQLAIAIDVTFAKGPGANDWRSVPLSKGPSLGWGPNIHPYLYRHFVDLAEKLDIPYQKDYMPRHSGTDAYGMQVVAEGIPTMVISIPLRYMHTPVELIVMKDIERTGRLLAEMIARLEVDFLDHISWDEVKNEE